MRLASSFIVMNLALVSVSPAFAGAKEDALTLHKAVVSGMMTYIELGESSDGRSRELGVAMEEKVTAPVARAQSDWRQAAGGNVSSAEYKAFVSCDVAAGSLMKVSQTISEYVKSDSTDEPDYDPLLTKFSEDLTLCEKELGVPLTF